MIKQYFLVIVSGLVILAAAMLCLTNIGNEGDVHLFSQTFPGRSIGLIMLISAIAGVITWKMIKIFGGNSWQIYLARKKQKKENVI